MNLGELLSELRESILNDRTDRVAGTSDYLWTDTQLVRFINEAQRRFATHALCIRDGSTDEVTLVTLVEGQTTYDLHDSVVAVLSAKIEGEQPDLTRVGHSVLNVYTTPNDRWVDPVSFVSLPPGRPLAYSTDEDVAESYEGDYGTVRLRVYPTPDAAAEGTQIRLRVARVPLDDFKTTDLTARCELPRLHQIEMLDWAAYLALRIEDDDAGSQRRANEYRQSFETHVRSARLVALRKLMAPTPWGFGRGGFSWR